MSKPKEPFLDNSDDPRNDPEFWKGYKRPNELTDDEAKEWGKIIDRTQIENAGRFARRLRRNVEFSMPDEMADQLVKYAIRCGEAVGYDEEQIRTDSPNCFLTLGSVHHVIKEVIHPDGRITLSFEENFMRQDLITNEWSEVSQVIDKQDLTYEGIRKIVINAFKHISSLNLYSAAEEVMDELSHDDSQESAHYEPEDEYKDD